MHHTQQLWSAYSSTLTPLSRTHSYAHTHAHTSDHTHARTSTFASCLSTSATRVHAHTGARRTTFHISISQRTPVDSARHKLQHWTAARTTEEAGRDDSRHRHHHPSAFPFPWAACPSCPSSRFLAIPRRDLLPLLHHYSFPR